MGTGRESRQTAGKAVDMDKHTGTDSAWMVVPRRRDDGGWSRNRRPWPAVTIGRTRDGAGRVTFNVVAWRAMGEPERVAFCYDGNRIGWRPDPAGTHVSTARQTNVPRYALDAAGVTLADVLGVHESDFTDGVLSFAVDVSAVGGEWPASSMNEGAVLT